MSDMIRVRQAAAEKAEKRMLDALIGFDPAGKLAVSDVKFIANYASSLAFDATGEVLSAQTNGTGG